MSSYHINDLDNNYSRAYSFLPNQDKDENGENLMTQSLVIQVPYRRIRHPELTPVILNRDREEKRNNYDIMSSSLIVPPYRRTRHAELTPVLHKEPSYKTYSDIRNRHQQQQRSFQLKPPKRAFSMTRLDQLAKPRQRYLEEALKLRASKTKENLCYSAVRPTSSMSLASKQQFNASSTPKSANNPTSYNNSNLNTNVNNNGTILLKQRTSARKQRPISYAGYSSSFSNNLSLNQTDSANTTFNRSSVKAKLPFNSVINNNRNFNSSHSNQTRNLMVSSIDNTMLSSLSKPTPPRKPTAHIKATVAARKLAKQQLQQETNVELDRFRKSDSTSRISSHLNKNNKNGSRDKVMMKKSVTNPGIAELLDERLNSNDEHTNERLNVKKVSNENNDRFDLDELLKSNEDKSIEHFKSNELDNMSNSTFIVMNDERDKSTDQDCQLIDFDNENAKLIDIKLSNEISNENSNENEEKAKAEEEEQEKIRLENEEMKRRALEEEKKNLAREEKERELERKVKEKAEKARLEMEERLRRDEQERIERKKRLDAIMSRTRKNPSSTKSASSDSQQTDDLNRTEKNQNPDVVEDAIKSNLIKLTKNENLNNSINNYIENETLIENKNINLINGFKEMKMSSNSTFVFSQQTSNETTTFAPRAN